MVVGCTTKESKEIKESCELISSHKLGPVNYIHLNYIVNVDNKESNIPVECLINTETKEYQFIKQKTNQIDFVNQIVMFDNYITIIARINVDGKGRNLTATLENKNNNINLIEGKTQ